MKGMIFMSVKKLYKSKIDNKICGVCGGIAEYFNIDSTIIRLIWVIAVFASFGTGVLAYFIAAIVMPDMPDGTTIIEDENGKRQY